LPGAGGHSRLRQAEQHGQSLPHRRSAAERPQSPAPGRSEQPHFVSFQRNLFCPGETVAFLGTGFGAAQGTGYVAVTVPLADQNGNVVHQMFAVPVLSWTENAISFVLNPPSGAIPGTYTTTVHRSNGRTASGT